MYSIFGFFSFSFLSLFLSDEDGSSPPPIVIPEDHADILTAIKEAEEKTRSKGGDPSPEVYVEALSLGVKQAEEARRNCEDDDRM